MTGTAQSNVIKVIVVEDDPLFLEELTAHLSRSLRIQVAATYNNAADAIAGIDKHAADVVLLDLGLPDRPGVEVIRQSIARGDAPEFLVLTVFETTSIYFPPFRPARWATSSRTALHAPTSPTPLRRSCKAEPPCRWALHAGC